MRLACLTMLPSLLLGALPAAALDLPPRKPGLWEMSVTTNIGPNNSRTQLVKHCVDADTDGLLRRLDMMSLYQAKCTRLDQRREGDAFVLDAECKAGEMDIVARGVTAGDFDADYTSTLTIRRLSNPEFPTIPRETTIVTAAKWAGLCTTDLKPGDMVMPNGLTASIYDLPGMPPAPATAPVADFVLPERAPGLWEVTTTVEGNPEQPPVVNMCLDAEIEREVNRIRVGPACSPPRVERLDGNTLLQWNCFPAAEKTRLRVVIAGDFENAYSIAITRSRDSGLPQFTLDTQEKIEGRRIGACRAGQAPGDTIYPDGRVVPYRAAN